MRNHKIKLLSVALLLLNGCSGNGSATGGGAPTEQTNEEVMLLENPVRLAQLGVLPASDNFATSYLLQLNNYSKDKYSLDSVRVIDLDTGKDSKLVSVASQACSIVSANGSCSIQLTPHTSQSADVKLEVKVKDRQGLIKTLLQLIRISGDLATSGSGIVMVNDVDRIVTEDGNYSLSIPVVLGEDYDDIKASNGSLLCNTSGYQKGSSCTYQVNGKVSGTSTVVSTRLEGIRAGEVATVKEANTKVEVGKGAHLLLTHGTKIIHPDTSGEITVYNNGTAEATNLAANIDASSGLEITTAAANACGTTSLEAGATCKIKVNVKSTTNGQAPVKITYTDDKTIHTALSNVRYKVAAASAGVTFSENNNNLANAIVRGKERVATVTIKNTGNRDLEGVSYHLAPAGSSGLTLTKADSNGCDLGAGAKLAANASCAISVKYKPTAVQASKSVNLVINSRYIDHNGQSHSLLSYQGLSYSATEVSASNLTWTRVTGNDVLSILSNGVESSSASWKLSNTLAADEGLTASKVKVSLNPINIEALTIVPVDAKVCGDDASIPGNAACEYIVKYGPTRNVKERTEISLKSEYTLDGKTLVSSDRFKVDAISVPKPKIEVTVTMIPSDGANVSGDGTLTNPWKFTTYQDKAIDLKYQFANNGTSNAPRFNVDVGNLPNGASVSSSTCPTGEKFSELAYANTNGCEVIVRIPDPEIFEIPNLVDGKLNSATLKLDLPYSYLYFNNIYQGNSDTKYINFNRLWANVNHTIAGLEEDDNNYRILVKSVAKIADKSTAAYPLTILPFLTHPINGVTLQSCTVKNENDSCQSEIVLPKSIFILGTPLIVTFKTSAAGLKDNDVILSNSEVKTGNNQIYSQAGLIYALNHQQANSTITLESDITLTKPWTMIDKLENVTFDGKGHKITGLNVVGNGRTGMFNSLNGATIKNLNLEGSAINKGGSSIGLLAAITSTGVVKISNCNFKSNVSATGNYAGGVIGSLDGPTIIESVTVDSKVVAFGQYIGGFAGYSEESINLSNIRVKTNVTGGTNVGGLLGYSTKSVLAQNVVVKADLDVDSDASKAGYIGGLIGAPIGLLEAKLVEAEVNINAKNLDFVGGLIGGDCKTCDLSNIFISGLIKTNRHELTNDSAVSGVINIITPLPKDSLKYMIENVDIVTETMVIGSFFGALIHENFLGLRHDNLYSILESKFPENKSKIMSGLTMPLLSSRNPDETKPGLLAKGFDFTNIWTIKKIDGIDSYGIKEGSIPQFPQW